MSKIVYVTNCGFNNNGELYPNYLYITKGNIKTYYDVDNVEIKPEDYHKYNIIISIGGSGVVQKGGMNENVKKKKKEKPISPAVQIIPHEEIKEPEPVALEQKIDDSINVMQDTANKVRLLHNIFSKISIFNFYNLNITESGVNLQGYIDKFSFLVPIQFMSDDVKYIEYLINSIIKVGDTYYCFKNTDIKRFVEFYDKAVIIKKMQSLDIYFASKKARNAYCINYNCYRISTRDNIGAQRQECNKCTKNKADKIVKPLTADVDGLDIQLNKTKKTIDGKIYDCIEISCGEIKVGSSYDKMCFNNYNASYWDKKTVRSDGYKRVDGDTLQPDFNTNEQTMFKYKIRGLTETERKKEREGKTVLIRGLPAGYVGDVKLFNNEKRYLCEMTYPFQSYLPGTIELDHVSGNHKDNTIDNIMPLCRICHSLKTYLAGDKGTGKDDKITSTDNDARPVDGSWVDEYNNIMSDTNKLRSFINKYTADVIDYINVNIIAENGIKQKMIDLITVKNLPLLDDNEKIIWAAQFEKAAIEREKRVGWIIKNKSYKRIADDIEKITKKKDLDEYLADTTNSSFLTKRGWQNEPDLTLAKRKKALHKFLIDIDIKKFEDKQQSAIAQP